MSFVPYLHFRGDCADAMQFYAEVFGGSLEMMTFADGPPEMFPDGELPAEAANQIMHACLTHSGGALMASDFPPGVAGDPQQAVSISHAVGDAASGKALFDRLTEGGGVVLMDFADTFWADGFGMVKDRFGTHWMISGPGKEPMAG
ncbi:MAG: VOC family protein [Acuticoccus sp.]